jgi:hypothetical protein
LKLWVDDLRTPPDASWVWITTPIVAIWMLDNHYITEISLDHDLGIDIAGNIGDTLTTRPIVLWMCGDAGYWPRKVHVHTANPVGREWLEGMIERYKP